MNRRITLATQQAISSFALEDQNQQMFGFHSLIDAILGETTEINGFACTPTGPASLTVNLASGQIFIKEPIDATDFGTPPSFIPADSREIMKFAFTLDPQQFTFVAPTTPGDSRNDLIQIGFEEVDGVPTAVPFFGGINNVTVLTPTGTTQIPVANNSITNTVNVERLDNVVVTVKSGTAAPTGTQVTPTPDAGFVGAWVITTTQGSSTITSNDINAYPTAPFINEKLKDKAGIPAIQSGQYIYADAAGTNTYTLSLNPALTEYTGGMQLFVGFTNINTGASTLNVNSLGAKPIKNKNGSALEAGQLSGGVQLYYDAGEDAFIITNIILNDFERKSLTNTGWRKLPDGTIEQWGVSSVAANDVATPVVLPIAFPNAGLNIIVSFYGSVGTAPISCGGEFVSTTTINLYQNDPSATNDVSWRVIGY